MPESRESPAPRAAGDPPDGFAEITREEGLLKTSALQMTYVRKDGCRCPAVVSVTALRDPHEAIIGHLLIGTDNTARRQAEEARQQMNAELSRAKLQAEKASLAKSDFLSSMSHELRSPLNAILGFAQLIDSGLPAPTPGHKESVDQTLQAGWRLLEHINEILDLSLIESGKLSLSPETISVTEVLADCHAMIGPQVLVNLLSNAIKYNRVGGSAEGTCRPGMHTLVCVEDNPASLMLIERLVARRPDLRLLTAIDANRGIEIARVARPQAILMDTSLPGIGGLTALWIRSEDPTTARIPVTALSANAVPRDLEKGLEAGFFRYLTKPIKVEVFMETIDMALKLSDADSIRAQMGALE